MPFFCCCSFLVFIRALVRGQSHSAAAKCCLWPGFKVAQRLVGEGQRQATHKNIPWRFTCQASQRNCSTGGESVRVAFFFLKSRFLLENLVYVVTLQLRSPKTIIQQQGRVGNAGLPRPDTPSSTLDTFQPQFRAAGHSRER